MKTTLAFLCALCLSCSGTTGASLKSDLATVGSTIVTCSQATCGGNNALPACVQLETATLDCLTNLLQGNKAACIAASPAAAAVAYADITCVLADLAKQSPTASVLLAGASAEIRTLAANLLAAQKVTVATVVARPGS
jgi:hypothetical protein